MNILGISIKPLTRSGLLPGFVHDRVIQVLVVGIMVLAIWDSQQALESLRFTMNNLFGIAPFLLLSIGLAAYAKASGADGLIAKAFTI